MYDYIYMLKLQQLCLTFFICMNFVFMDFYKYYIDVLSIEVIVAFNNLLAKSWLINTLWIAMFITIATFTAKLHSLLNISFDRWLCGSVTEWIKNESINTLRLWWGESKSIKEQTFCKTVRWKPLHHKTLMPLFVTNNIALWPNGQSIKFQAY